jgi:PAS domain S-box-containing protein
MIQINRANLLDLLESVDSNYVLTDSAGVICAISKKIESEFGISGSQQIGSPIRNLFIHPENAVTDLLDSSTLSPGEYIEITDILLKTGQEKGDYVNIGVKNLTHVESIEGYLLSFSQSSESITLDSAPEIDPLFAVQVIRHIGEGLAVTDPDENFIYVNPTLEQMIGFTSEELIGLNSKDVVYEYHHPHVDNALETRKAKEKSIYEIHLKSKSGKPVEVRITSVSLWKEEEFIGSIAIIRDITELNKKAAALRKALVKTEEAKKEKERFLASMSHEIRTPLTGMLGLTQLILQTDIDEEQRNYLESIEISAKNLTKILNDLLHFSELDFDSVRIVQKPFQIVKMVNQLCNTFNRKAAEKQIDYHVNVDHSIPEKVVGDEERYLQVVMQILANAFTFTDQGEIKVFVLEVERDDEQIFINTVIDDTGVGIPEDIRKSLFKSFSKASRNTMSKHGGTGLGLAIVKKLIDLMGGKISVVDKSGNGTVISFTIPFGLVTRLEKTTGTDESAAENRDKNDLSGRKILVADDHPINQKLLIGMLEKSGVNVLKASDGHEVIEVCQENPDIDLILMDVHMPGMNGLEATRKIRDEFVPNLSEVPILAVTASVMSSDIDAIREAGMNDFISKPFTIGELKERITGYLTKSNLIAEKHETSKPETDDSSELLIDFVTLRDMTNNDEDIMLELIELFLEHTPIHLRKMENALEEKKWYEVGVIAHTLKPTYMYMEMPEAHRLSLELEECKEESFEANEEKIAKLVDKLVQVTEDAYHKIEKSAMQYRFRNG